MDISTGQGVEEGEERRGAKTAVEVGDEAGLRKAAKGEECGMRRESGSRNGDERDGEEPQVRRGRLGAGEEGESGGGRVEHGDRGRSENGQAVR